LVCLYIFIKSETADIEPDPALPKIR